MILPILACVLGLAASRAAAEEGAKSLDASWVNAMKAGDVNAVVALYAPDAVLWLPDAPEARGEKAIRATYAGMLGAYTVADASLTNAVYHPYGDVSIQWGNFTLVLKPKAGGQNVVMKGRFMSAAKKSDGQWRYIADHASAEPPPAATQPAAK
jgi:uncharacterized protein (TIGR02246 family)